MARRRGACCSLPRQAAAAAAAVAAVVAAASLPTCGGQVVAVPQPPEMVNTQCLLYHGDGCSAIRDEKTCLNSRDGRFFDLLHGRRIRGQPCVWCGGEACSEQSENRCEPYQWVMGNPLVKQPSAWQAANCLDRRSVHQTLAAVPGRSAVVGPVPSTFRPVEGGEGRACRGVSTLDDGTGMIGFGGGQQWEYSIYTAASFEQCQSFCKSSCVGVEFRAADLYCEIWWDLVTSSSPREGYQCYAKETECLTWRSHGCSALTDKGKCLSSKDGRQTVASKYRGIEVYGSPCAWCGGGPCHDGSSSVCEPVSLLAQGEGRYFSSLYARDQYLIADCASGTAVGEPTRGLLLPGGHSAVGSGTGGIDGTTVGPSDAMTPSQSGVPQTNAAVGGGSQNGGIDSTAASSTAAPFGAGTKHEDPAETTDGDSAAGVGMGEAHGTTFGPAGVSTPRHSTLPGTSPGSSSSGGQISGPGVPGGTFISSQEGSLEGAVVYWYDAAGKHPLAKGTHCSSCGCSTENIKLLGQAQIDLIPTADLFHCVALNPTGAPLTVTPPALQSPVARFIRVAGAGAEKANNVGGNPTASGSAKSAGAGAGAGGEVSGVSDSHVAGGRSQDPVTFEGQGSEGELWWEDRSGTVHKVPAGYDCSVCGCDTVSVVSPNMVASMSRGTDFDCSMTPGQITMVSGAGSAHALPPAGGTKEKKLPHKGQDGSMAWLIIILIILIILAIAMCLWSKSKSDKKKELALLEGARTQRLQGGVFDDLEQMGGLSCIGESSEESDDAEESSIHASASSRDPLIVPRSAKVAVVPGPKLQAAAAASTVTAVPPPPQPAQRRISTGSAQQVLGAESTAAPTQFHRTVAVTPPPSATRGAPTLVPAQGPQFRRTVDVAPPAAQARGAAILAAAPLEPLAMPREPLAVPREPLAVPREPLAVPREPLARGGMAGGGAGGAGGVGGAAGRPSVFDMIDHNHDGVLSRQEWDRYAFDAFDQNHDASVSRQEWIDGRTRP